MSKNKQAIPQTSDLPQTKEKDPLTSIDRIDDLVSRILRGDILLPKFQREFVLTRKKIITLLDSISRGYPIGSVLLWETKNRLSSSKRIADLDIIIPRPEYPVNYLLDGQQRLTVICGALHWKGNDPKSQWNIAYDLRMQKFVTLDTLDEPPIHQIRLNKMPDSASYFSHVGSFSNSSAPDKSILESRAKELFRRFINYKIATVTLFEMDIRAVAPIFERINSTGTVLTIVDLMRAVTWDPDFDLIDSIDSILGGLEPKGFHEIENKYVLRSFSAAAQGGFSKGSTDVLRGKTVEELNAIVADTRAAYQRMADFLTTQIHVTRSAAVPYANQMTVLAEVFRCIPRPSASQFRAIEHWFWRTSLTAHFAGWNTSQMAADLSAIREFASGSSDEIRFDSPTPTEEIWKTGRFNTKNAYTKLFALVLSHYRPVDLLNGQLIDTSGALAWSNVKEFHHLFPKDYLKKKGYKTDRINVFANFIMLTSSSNKTIMARAPSDYLPQVERMAEDHFQAWLESNLISKEAHAAALSDDFEKFVELRAKTLHEAVLKKAGWSNS